ncbi:F-box protein At4g00755-like, partial [Helianthus annuus]|uniref:F-box protein At4g00755-like n=1 Tax=Helianthus annuus TaxID=4232 RepID=UPI001652E430
CCVTCLTFLYEIYLLAAVVSNGLRKQLCMRTCPRLASITRVAEPSHDNSGVTKRDHRAYVSLFRAITTFQLNYCVASPSSVDTAMVKAACARQSRWIRALSSSVKVVASLLATTASPRTTVGMWGLALHPFQGLFELDFPTCSSGDMRFQTGHPKSWKELNCDFIAAQECADDKFIWAYTSPMLPVSQVSPFSIYYYSQKGEKIHVKIIFEY